MHHAVLNGHHYAVGLSGDVFHGWGIRPVPFVTNALYAHRESEACGTTAPTGSVPRPRPAVSSWSWSSPSSSVGAGSWQVDAGSRFGVADRVRRDRRKRPRRCGRERDNRAARKTARATSACLLVSRFDLRAVCGVARRATGGPPKAEPGR
jgi:hypothetical protein